MDFLAFLNDIPAILGQHLSTIIGLIFLDVVLGVAAAIKRGWFDWRVVGEFYTTNVLPYVLGYVAVSGAALFVSPELLAGEAGDVFGLAVTWLGFGAIVGQLVLGSILGNAKSLFTARFAGGAEPPIIG